MSKPVKSKKPKKWYNVVPVGTTEGDEEQKFFIALARNKKYTWRGVAALAAETGLTEVRIDEIIEKYDQMGLIFQNPKNEDMWGYWERNPELVSGDIGSLAHEDKEDRINTALTPDRVNFSGGVGKSGEEATPQDFCELSSDSTADKLFVDETAEALSYAVFYNNVISNLSHLAQAESDKQLVSDFVNLSEDAWTVKMPAFQGQMTFSDVDWSVGETKSS